MSFFLRHKGVSVSRLSFKFEVQKLLRKIEILVRGLILDLPRDETRSEKPLPRHRRKDEFKKGKIFTESEQKLDKHCNFTLRQKENGKDTCHQVLMREMVVSIWESYRLTYYIVRTRVVLYKKKMNLFRNL